MPPGYAVQDCKRETSSFAGDDACLRGAYACFFTGEALVGTFGADEGIRTAMGAEVDAFLESLFGRFCFALLRPYLAD